jgi:hypothetical protein
MPYIILRGLWCHVIVLKVNAPIDDKIDDVKNSFYKKPECLFDKFPTYHMTIMLGNFIAKVGKEDNFKPTVGNESLYKIGNDNGVRVVNLATSKNVIVKSTMFQHWNIHKYIWTSPNEETHNQINHILIDR